MVKALIVKLAQYLSAVFFLIVAFILGSKSGLEKAREKQERDRSEAIRKAKDVDERLSKMDNDSIRDRAKRWVRDD